MALLSCAPISRTSSHDRPSTNHNLCPRALRNTRNSSSTAVMAAWRRKETAEAYFFTADAGDKGKKIPKGYIPLALVGEDGNGDERVVVRIGALKEPCMAALLEMAAQQFGYGQPGVLRIPCDGRQFQRMVSAMCSKSKSKAT